MRRLLALALIVALPGTAYGQDAISGKASPYAGEVRMIKSLSKDDITELRRGGGWGLAKAAELNGVPGPKHLLELKDNIPLSASQVLAIRAIFASMRAEAIAEGERLIAFEQELDYQFREGTITENNLRRLLANIAESHRNLRYIHLSTHLTTPSLLTDAQITRYNALRGYGNSPCSQVPAGDNAETWRKHNNCD